MEAFPVDVLSWSARQSELSAVMREKVALLLSAAAALMLLLKTAAALLLLLRPAVAAAVLLMLLRCCYCLESPLAISVRQGLFGVF